MEFFLDLADDYVFDKLYAKVLPATSFLPAAVQQASSATAANGTAAAATVKSLLSYVPHPPLPSAESLEGLSAWPRDYMPRQYISLYLMVFAGILLMYPSMAGFSYYCIFDHRMMKHPRFLKNQVRQEIIYSLQAFPWLILMTTPWFVYEVRGGGLFYDKVADYGWAYLAFSIPLFLVFTDFCIYWIHRIEHHPALYKHVHKPHHKWIVPTPWAAFAFHPIDGYVQSLPYHIFPMIFPLHKKLYVGLFVIVNIWTIFIHDSDMISGHWLENVINGPAHHTLHHLHFTVNYGQYFTWSDRAGGSYKKPDPSLDPILAVEQLEREKEKRSKADAAAELEIIDVRQGEDPTDPLDGSALKKALP